MVLGDFLFVLEDLAIQFVGQQINGGVHAFGHGFGMKTTPGDVDGRFRLVFDFLDGKDDVYRQQVIEVARGALELGLHVLAQRRRDFDRRNAAVTST